MQPDMTLRKRDLCKSTKWILSNVYCRRITYIYEREWHKWADFEREAQQEWARSELCL